MTYCSAVKKIVAKWILSKEEIYLFKFDTDESITMVVSEDNYFDGGTPMFLASGEIGDSIEMSRMSDYAENYRWVMVIKKYLDGEFRAPDEGRDPRIPKEPPKPLNRFAFIEDL